MGFFVADETPVIWRGPMLHKALEQFLVDAYWGEPDFLLDRHAAGHRGRHALPRPVPDQDGGVRGHHAQPAAERVAQRSAYAARKLKLSGSAGSSRT